MADELAAVDALRNDMALHQRNHVGEVTDSKNHGMAAEAIARIEREQAEVKPAPAQADHPELHPVTAERREGKHGNYLLSTSATDDVKHRTATPAEHWFLTHAMPRVELLMSKLETGPLGQPSWMQRTFAVMELQSRVSGLRARGLHQSADEITRRFTFELMQLLESSVATFGDWKVDPGTRVSITVR